MTVRLITLYSKITDYAGVQEYVEKVGPVLDKFGVQRDFAGPVLRLVEGGPVDAAGVLIFPDVETLDRFYDSEEYAPLKALRQRSTETVMVVVDGVWQPSGPA